MNKVLDASALLALLQNEKGAAKVENAILNQAVISTVNWSEVIQKSVAKNINIANLDSELKELGLSYFPFDIKQAEIAADLWGYTKTYGLSLADRTCLALAIHLNIPVLTADKIWQQLNIGVDIELIRE